MGYVYSIYEMHQSGKNIMLKEKSDWFNLLIYVLVPKKAPKGIENRL